MKSKESTNDDENYKPRATKRCLVQPHICCERPVLAVHIIVVFSRFFFGKKKTSVHESYDLSLYNWLQVKIKFCVNFCYNWSSIIKLLNAQTACGANICQSFKLASHNLKLCFQSQIYLVLKDPKLAPKTWLSNHQIWFPTASKAQNLAPTKCNSHCSVLGFWSLIWSFLIHKAPILVPEF